MALAREGERTLGTYVALLRGINVGGRTTVSMADLRMLFLALGSEDVTTYVQSGNVVFKFPLASPAELAPPIEAEIRRRLDLSVKVVVRTGAQLARVVADNPFAADGLDPGKLHVAFLAESPDPARVHALEAKPVERDEFRVVGEEVYLHYPSGYGKTKLTNAFLEKQLAVAATTRNWRTTTKLAELANV
ncbi:MAG: DUF1697 domain-containing protein [Actinomycetota bacterium]|nr:DUF1697 domain-containing protein [Actinomycetota bacterium]